MWNLDGLVIVETFLIKVDGNCKAASLLYIHDLHPFFLWWVNPSNAVINLFRFIIVLTIYYWLSLGMSLCSVKSFINSLQIVWKTNLHKYTHFN